MTVKDFCDYCKKNCFEDLELVIDIMSPGGNEYSVTSSIIDNDSNKMYLKVFINEMDNDRATMTVGELRKRLKEYNKNFPVYFDHYNEVNTVYSNYGNEVVIYYDESKDYPSCPISDGWN